MEQTLGKRIVANRKRLQLTQDQLAEKLGVTAQAVSKWENDLSCPDISSIPQLAEIFGITTDELLGHEHKQATHVGEIVDEYHEEESSGFHGQSGHWNFTWNSGRKSELCLAVAILAVGILYLCSTICKWDLSFWDILWPTALLIWGVFGVMPRFSFFHLGCILFGGYFLITKLLPFPYETDRNLIIAAAIVLLGLSLVVDALRKSKSPRFTYKYNKSANSKRPKGNYSIDEDQFTYYADFGEATQFVTMEKLRHGVIETNFGEYTVDLSNVSSVSENCTIYAKCTFGELTVLVPRRFEVVTNSTTAFAELNIEGQANDITEGKILIDATVQFGEIEIRYT